MYALSNAIITSRCIVCICTILTTWHLFDHNFCNPQRSVPVLVVSASKGDMGHVQGTYPGVRPTNTRARGSAGSTSNGDLMRLTRFTLVSLTSFLFPPCPLVPLPPVSPLFCRASLPKSSFTPFSDAFWKPFLLALGFLHVGNHAALHSLGGGPY